MKILVTGANGFIGKNLVSELQNRGYKEIFEWNRLTSNEEINEYTKKCDFVVHLAGENRPKHIEDYKKVNVDLTKRLLQNLRKNNNKSPILFASSTQVDLYNEYGNTKREAENIIKRYGKENDVNTYIYRLNNIFGKWCKPNYNSVVATFCNNIANNIPIKLNDKKTVIKLSYIDDVIDDFINVIQGKIHENKEINYMSITYEKTLEEIASEIKSFKNMREKFFVPDLKNNFTKKLYSTYLSYIPKNQFSYSLDTISDKRGSFTELFKSNYGGQISLNVIKPNCIKGNHWHHTKNEKFVVISGEGIIKFKNVNSEEELEYKVDDKNIQVVDIPVGYVHSIINTGDKDMFVIIWASENFNKEKTDTYYKNWEG